MFNNGFHVLFFLQILNTTHDSVTLFWTPGFDGGQPQYFRIRYRSKSSSSYQFVDVLEFGVYTYTVTGLSLNTEYYFSIQSRNNAGDSEYRGEFVRAITRSKYSGASGHYFYKCVYYVRAIDTDTTSHSG